MADALFPLMENVWSTMRVAWLGERRRGIRVCARFIARGVSGRGVVVAVRLWGGVGGAGGGGGVGMKGGEGAIHRGNW